MAHFTSAVEGATCSATESSQPWASIAKQMTKQLRSKGSRDGDGGPSETGECFGQEESIRPFASSV